MTNDSKATIQVNGFTKIEMVSETVYMQKGEIPEYGWGDTLILCLSCYVYLFRLLKFYFNM